jgi:hypothetical protein
MEPPRRVSANPPKGHFLTTQRRDQEEKFSFPAEQTPFDDLVLRSKRPIALVSGVLLAAFAPLAVGEDRDIGDTVPGGARSTRRVLADDQLGILDGFRRQQRGIGDRNDLLRLAR